MEEVMSKSRELLEIAKKCFESANETKDGARKKFLRRLAHEWKNLAQAQAWLDGEGDLTNLNVAGLSKSHMSKDVRPRNAREKSAAQHGPAQLSS
jgi:hypothetical protein